MARLFSCETLEVPKDDVTRQRRPRSGETWRFVRHGCGRVLQIECVLAPETLKSRRMTQPEYDDLISSLDVLRTCIVVNQLC